MYSAECLKEIYWKGRIYCTSDKIKVNANDLEILRGAGVIGGIKRLSDKEFAVKKAPENAKKTHRKRSK